MSDTVVPITISKDGEIHIRTNAEISVAELNKALLMLPANSYIDLFHEMQMKIYGYSTFAVANSGCGCSGTCGEQEEKSYSEQLKKVERKVGNSPLVDLTELPREQMTEQEKVALRAQFVCNKQNS